MARTSLRRFGSRSALAALLAVAAVAAIAALPAGAVDDPVTAPVPAPTPETPTPETTETVLASGIDGVGLTGATDDLDGAPLEVRAVDALYPTIYDKLSGTRLITDRWSDAGDTQGRSYLTTRGAKVSPRPTAKEVIVRDATGAVTGTQWIDFGAEWLSRRTFRTTFTLPAGTTPTATKIDLLADNNVTVYVTNSAGRQLVTAPTCSTYEACNKNDANGRDNFQKVRTVSFDPAMLKAGDNTFEFAVDDWGTVVGVQFKVTITTPVKPNPKPTPPCSTANPQVSCSLTASILPTSPAGTARYCYVSSDGTPRTFRVKLADGSIGVHTLATGTWTDAPIPADDVVLYPVEDSPIPFAALRDDTLSRCPGAVGA